MLILNLIYELIQDAYVVHQFMSYGAYIFSTPYVKNACLVGCVNMDMMEEHGCYFHVENTSNAGDLARKRNISHRCGAMPESYPPPGIKQLY